MTTSGPESIGSFRILGKLGQGGMGTVYQAVHGTLERPVALKVLPPEFANNPEYVMRFLREARTIATLRHDNIVQVYDAGEQNGQYYIAMELVDGVNLLKFAEERPEVPEAEGLGLLLQAAKGLASAHTKGLVHRDIKPENLLLGKDGILRIVDFGLVMESTSTTQLTATGACLGTPMYMSPEQADGESADSRTDLYSLGVTFYRVFTGRTPFTSPTVMNLLFKHKFEAPPEPRAVQPKLSQGTSNLLMHLLAKRREDRPQTAQKLIEMIELVQKGKSIPPPPKFLPQPIGESSVTMMAPSERIAPVRDPAVRRKLTLAAIGIVVVITLVTAWVSRSPSGQVANGKNIIQPVNSDQPGADAIRKGDSAYDSGDYNGALNLYNVALKDAPNSEQVKSRIDRARGAIAFKESMAAGASLEANGQLEDAAKQYAIAVKYDRGTQAQLKLEIVRTRIEASKNPLPPAKISVLDQEVTAAKEAEGSKAYDKAAEHYSQAAQLSDPPLKVTYAEKAQDCRRLDYVARGMAAEQYKDFQSAEQYYRMAQQIREDSATGDRLEAIRIRLAATATTTTQTTTGGFDAALAEARKALDSGNYKLARQKVDAARQLQPSRAEAVAMAKELDGREDMIKGDEARARGDTEQALVWYSNARDVWPALKEEATVRIDSMRNKPAPPPAARDDKVEALVRAYKYSEALKELAAQITANPSNTQLTNMRDALESMRSNLSLCDEMQKIADSARQALSDAQDYEEEAGDKKKDFVRLKTRFADAPSKQQSSFLTRDYEGVKTISRSSHDDAVDAESKLSSGAAFLERKSDRSRGTKIIGIGTGDADKSDALGRYARSLRKLLERTRELIK